MAAAATALAARYGTPKTVASAGNWASATRIEAALPKAPADSSAISRRGSTATMPGGFQRRSAEPRQRPRETTQPARPGQPAELDSCAHTDRYGTSTDDPVVLRPERSMWACAASASL